MAKNQGYYYIATDKDYMANAGNTDDYKHLIQGVLLSNGNLVTFTGFTNQLMLDEDNILNILDSVTVN